MLLQEAAAAGAHPLAGTAAEWLWLVILLPLLGAAINGFLSTITGWRPGPFDPDFHRTGEFPAAPASTLVERASRLVGGGDVATGTSGPATLVTGTHSVADGTDSQYVEDVYEDSLIEAYDEKLEAPPRHRFLPLVSVVGVGTMAIAFVIAVLAFLAMVRVSPETPLIRNYWTWMAAGGLDVAVSLHVDQLSIVMTLVITGVGTLIHLFSTGYMRDDRSYARFFAYMNLFVFFMLVLVLGSSYLIMFIGWEGVGVCSYLLIGFWFTEEANADAGKKAFIVNRIGDVGFLVAMFMMFWNFHTLDFMGVNAAAAALPIGTALVTTIALFLFMACAGKSAQLPLYVWLPDAMAGPTPVSALIHAATMVTAGVYLVVRSGAVFAAAPSASLVVAMIGTLTALFAALIGLKQWDIKKVLAYSTISQLGYMFMAVGVGAYTAGVFHLVTHAFFKALLFLGAGSVIFAMHRAYHVTGNHDDAQDMRNMGGFRRFMPVTWAMMWIATLAISGIPPFAGFFSKDEILGSVFAHATGSTLAEASLLGVGGSSWLYLFYALGLLTALITAVYMTRMMLYTFHGPTRTGEVESRHLREAPWTMTVPVVVLGLLSIGGGWLNIPELLGMLGPVGRLEHWLDPVVASAAERLGGGAALEHALELTLIAIAIAIAVVGIVGAVVLLRPARLLPKAESPREVGIQALLADKFRVDELYDRFIVQPLLTASRRVLYRGLDIGIIDRIMVVGFGWSLPRFLAYLGSRLQSGLVSDYAWVMVVGVILVLGVFTLR